MNVCQTEKKMDTGRLKKDFIEFSKKLFKLIGIAIPATFILVNTLLALSAMLSSKYNLFQIIFFEHKLEFLKRIEVSSGNWVEKDNVLSIFGFDIWITNLGVITATILLIVFLYLFLNTLSIVGKTKKDREFISSSTLIISGFSFFYFSISLFSSNFYYTPIILGISTIFVTYFSMKFMFFAKKEFCETYVTKKEIK